MKIYRKDVKKKGHEALFLGQSLGRSQGVSMRLFTMFLLLLTMLVSTATVALADFPSERQYRATVIKESRGNTRAIGDRKYRNGRPRPSSGWAYGDLQIRQCYVDDVNARYGTHYKSSDCYSNPTLSKKIYRMYINMYATRRLLKHKPTMDDMSGIHNGGPKGWKSKNTIGYRDSVRHIRKSLK